MPISDLLLHAIQVFIDGFTFTRSFTHPYLATPLSETVIRLHDAPRTHGDCRGDEIIAHTVAPPDLHAMIQSISPNRYTVCYVLPIGADASSMRSEFKALGYRLGGTELFFRHGLSHLPDVPAPLPVLRVTTLAQTEAVAKAARRRLILPEHIRTDSAPIRAYAAMDQETPVAWVASVACGDSAWCTNMYVCPAYRRRGIARSLMAHMLRDDKETGATESVLLASHAGAKLYPTLGYEPIGTLYLFTPPR